ncbi:MAG: MFS transporter [Bacteroidetes bacterium]|nr:MFS transporter [Bacteroidota bacterium]MBT7466296.1 MFS transporter [Bacteroidota bacterium]
MPFKFKISEEYRNPTKILIIFCLIMGGEIIFGLPFHLVRYFRPTFIDVFNISNTQLGDAMAIYGVTAMLSYFPGGIIADYLSARRLMSISLLATALGGFYLTTIPGQMGLSIVFGYWGVTTILLFWSAMIRATREWGGKLAQGRAFGILDGGRGLFGAGAATIAVFFLAAFFPKDLENISPDQRRQAMVAVIYFYTFLTMGAAILIWFIIPDSGNNKKKNNNSSNRLSGIVTVLKNRSAWLQAIIVICAYCGYRGLDFYALYGIDILGMNEVSAARFVSNATFLRPVGAILAGFLADRFSSKKVIGVTFTLLIICYAILMIFTSNHSAYMVLMINFVFTFLAVYALRGVYFALFEEMQISGTVTGTTVGLVSIIGFTPDIFFNSIAGRIIDASPGYQGYQNFFLFLACFAGVGLIATSILAYRIKSRNPV